MSETNEEVDKKIEFEDSKDISLAIKVGIPNEKFTVELKNLTELIF